MDSAGCWPRSYETDILVCRDNVPEPESESIPLPGLPFGPPLARCDPQALERIPYSVSLWKSAIELVDEDDAKVGRHCISPGMDCVSGLSDPAQLDKPPAGNVFHLSTSCCWCVACFYVGQSKG